MNRHCYLTLFLITAAVVLSGCNSEGTRPVTGIVTLDGEPLSDVFVTYYPIGGGRGNSNAQTDDQGRYALRYTSTAKGAIPGNYKVLISKTKKMPNGVEKELLPARYNTKSELIAEIQSSGTNVFNFDLTSKD